MARFDYRRQYKDMDIEQLKIHMEYNKKRYDEFFVKGNAEIADGYYRVYSYLQNRINKISKKETK